MIPLRVKLRGFLCYKDEQEVTFAGSSLWLLAGLNGSGKSAIFDAVTYALFGHHRGGSQQAQELINKNSDRLAVELEFLQDNLPYRIQRTLRRNTRGGASGTQEIARPRAAEGNGEHSWEIIEGTTRKAEFDGWVRDNIGLNYETFTSSVLLLQGRAEKLLDSTAKGRFEVLAGIVDLDRYKKLHEKADEHRRRFEGEVKALHDRLLALPEVVPIEILEAEGHVSTTEQARQEAGAACEQLQELEYQARKYVELQARLTAVQRRRVSAQTLCDDAAAIERAAQRLHELRQHLPTIKNIVDQRTALHQSERELTEFAKQKQKNEAELAQHDDGLQKGRQQAQLHRAAQEQDEHRQRRLSEELPRLATQLEKLSECERHERDLRELEQQRALLPAEPEAEAHTARTAYEQLDALARTLPLLQRFAEQRQQLQVAGQRLHEASEARQRIQAEGKQQRAEKERLHQDLAATIEARRSADDRTAAARTLRDQGREQLRELRELHGAKLCRHCGQTLTPAHLEQETARRTADLAERSQQLAQAEQGQREAHQREQILQAQHTKLEESLRDARAEYTTHDKLASQAREDVERLFVKCGETYRELPQPTRTQISTDPRPDWAATTYPTSEVLQQLRLQTRGLDAARQQLRAAEEVLQKRTLLQQQETHLRQHIARIGAELPKERASVRTRHLELVAEDKTLQQAITARKGLLAGAQQDFERLSKQREMLQRQLVKVTGGIEAQTRTQQLCRQALQRYLQQLPIPWHAPAEAAGMADIDVWTRERDALVAAQTEERQRQLREARGTLDSLAQEEATLAQQLTAFAPNARQEPSQIQQQLQQARQTLRQRDEELNRARQTLTLLESRREERGQVQAQALNSERQLNHARLLADLLGRERLQMHLVRQAERQVIDHANAVLDRLTGGELYLRLVGEAAGDGVSAKALELEAHNRTTGEAPINVAFLSGSQKFRVAVSLALGIGQYASRQHRPIESVIIDEGFGCLDRNARQVMIQELQNLRSQMRCILLVSHQEEFADAFADGYHFELQNGATVARRFQR